MRRTERHALLTLSFWRYSLLTQLDSITVAEIQSTRVSRLILVEYVLCILAHPILVFRGYEEWYRLYRTRQMESSSCCSCVSRSADLSVAESYLR